MVTYCPTVTEDILSLLINKMVTIDVRQLQSVTQNQPPFFSPDSYTGRDQTRG